MQNMSDLSDCPLQRTPNQNWLCFPSCQLDTFQASTSTSTSKLMVLHCSVGVSDGPHTVPDPVKIWSERAGKGMGKDFEGVQVMWPER